MVPPTTTTLGGVKRNTGSAGQFVSGISATGELEYGTPAGGGKILQLQPFTALAPQVVTDSTPVSVLTGSITPSSASSRVKITITGYVGNQSTTSAWHHILRGSTPIFRGNAEGSRTRAASGSYVSDSAGMPVAITFVDSPASTIPVIYNFALSRDAATGAVYLNRSHTDTNAATFGRGAACMILEEIGP